MSRYIISLNNSLTKYSELINTGVSLPEGFVITSEVFFELIKQNKLTNKIDKLISTINFDHPDSILQVSEIIKKLIITFSFPESIRHELSSFYNNFSNYEEPRVNIYFENLHRPIIENIHSVEDLISKIKESWALKFSPHELLLRHKQKLGILNIELDLIVQREIKPEIFGISYTSNPQIKDRSKIIIKLNHAYENYSVSKSTLKISNKIYLTKKPILNEKQIIEIAEQAKKIERVLYFSQKIHWGIENGKIYILKYKPL